MRADEKLNLSPPLRGRTWTLGELCSSATAKRNGIINLPLADDTVTIGNLRRLVRDVLNPLETKLRTEKLKLVINSCYRTPELNAKLEGSSPKSAHMSGLAADVTAIRQDDEPPQEPYLACLRNCLFMMEQGFQPDQVIVYPDRFFVHIGLAADGEEPREDVWVFFRTRRFLVHGEAFARLNDWAREDATPEKFAKFLNGLRTRCD